MSQDLSKEVDCPYCGPTPINHFLSKTVLIIDLMYSPINGFFISIQKALRTLFRVLGFKNTSITFFKMLARLGMATIVDRPDQKNSDRAKCLWEAADKRGIKMFEIRFFNNSVELFWCEYKGQKIFFECLPRPYLTDALDWMDNKAEMRKRFAAADLPIAKGGVCFRYSKALKILNKMGPSLITKPHIGSRSRHTTIHIQTPEELKKAFKIAQMLSPLVIVEQELKGTVHRVTMIGEKLVAVMRRDPPFVVGDGEKTIRQLIEIENTNPKRQGPHFHHIPIDEFTDEELKRQNLNVNSVLGKDEKIIVRNNIGRSAGGSNTNVMAEVHPENILLFEKIAKVIGDPLFGMDFIIDDASKPWHEQMPCGAIELNSVPFLDLHHFPLYGQPIDASGALWNTVFPASSSVK